MKKTILLLALVMSSAVLFAQSDTTYMVTLCSETYFTGNTPVTGGYIQPHFTDASVDTITAKYSFKTFYQYCPGCFEEFLRVIYVMVATSGQVCHALSNAYPVCFVGCSGPLTLQGIPLDINKYPHPPPERS